MKTILFNPFEKYSEKELLITGSIFTIIGSLMAFLLNTRFDGVIDLHMVASASIKNSLLDNFINIISIILFLFISSKYINTKTRLIDLFTTVIIARIPYYILPLFNISDFVQSATQDILKLTNPELITELPTNSLIIISLFSIVSVLFLIWYITLLYNGFKTASNAKGKIPIFLFIASIILSEMLSKFLIFQLN